MQPRRFWNAWKREDSKSGGADLPGAGRKSRDLEGAVLSITALVLGLAHLWNYNRHDTRKTKAEEALRLDAIRKEAVKQLKSEHRMWSVAAQSTST
jgi:hypothetical protein